MSDPLTLARRLSALDDDALTALLRLRQPAVRDVRDFFDLADALLDPASVRQALRTLDRPTIKQLADADVAPASVPSLETLALVHPSEPDDPHEGSAAHPYDAVRSTAQAVLDSTVQRRPSGAEPFGHDEAAISARARENAFLATAAAAELVHQLRAAPVRVRSQGVVAATERKRLAPSLGLEPDAVGALIEAATAARLVAIDSGALLSTTAADAWSSLPLAERWETLVVDWVRQLAGPERSALLAGAPHWLGGESLRSAFTALYPAADDAMVSALARIDAVGELLGLTVDGSATAFGEAALAAAFPTSAENGNPTGEAGATGAGSPANHGASTTSAATMRPVDELPAEIDQVYLQHDLTLIAPGPLTPAVDSRVRRLADVEARGVASTYRISQSSLDRALAVGETEATLRQFLAGISLTGIPQALDYLLTEAARRHGLVRVSAADAVLPPSADLAGSHPDARRDRFDRPPGGIRSIVRSADPALLRALAVDQSLHSLALHPEADGSLSSRVDPATVYWSLLDAHYPVLAETAEGGERLMRRSRILDADALTPEPSATPPAVVELVQRLRSARAQSPDDATAWIGRRLDQAVRSRTPVGVEVRMPDGSITQLDVTPLSLANGRLRCVDVRAGVERTVPVANIVRLTTP